MNQLKKAPGRVFLVAFMAAAGLFASAAPGLGAEQPNPVVPLAASQPAAPAQPTADDPDDEPSADDPDADDASSGGGWSGKNTSTAGEDPDEVGEGDETSDDGRDEDSDSDDGDYADQGDPDDEDSSSVQYGTEKQTKAEKAAAERASKKAKIAQQKAQKKAAASKKYSSAKKKQKEAARKKARQQAAKKMRQQAVRAAKQAAARDAAERRADQQQRRAVADDEPADNPRSGGSIDSLRDAILDLTNKARNSAGCNGTLRYSTQLERSAQAHANDMSEHHYMSHQSRSGKNSDQRIRATGFRGDKTGENLGEGFSSPEAVFKAWMGSSSHRRNILDCGFKILGVGYNGGYWAQHFGG